jgi:hypothetical protein
VSQLRVGNSAEPSGAFPCEACGSVQCYWITSPGSVECLCVDCGGTEAHAKLSRLAIMVGPASPHFDRLLALCERAESLGQLGGGR